MISQRPLDMTGAAPDLQFDSTSSDIGRSWSTTLEPVVTAAALAVLGFFWLVVLGYYLAPAPRMRNFLIFATSISILPTACAAIILLSGNDRSRVATRLFKHINVWGAATVLLAVTLVGTLAWRPGDIGLWQKNAIRTVQSILCLHLALIVMLASVRRRPAELQRIRTRLARFSSWSAQAITLAYSFAAAFIALFSIQPRYKYFNGLFGYFFPASPGGFPSVSQFGTAFLLTGLFVLCGLCLLMHERGGEATHPARPSRLQKLGLVVACVAAVALTFDFSLATDAFHYMTNIGPALHLMNGGTLMVDTFSQYGPGPVLLTYLAFRIGPPSFATANIAIQFMNELFYVLFLVALWQSMRYRLAALWFGLGMVAFWMADWAYGAGNVNAAPSVLGARYLPIMLMAVAIGAGKPGERGSWLTWLASFLAATWSAEAIIGVLALHIGFLVLLNIRERTWQRLALDVVMTCLPVGAGLCALTAGIRLTSGMWPAFSAYLGFFESYNPVADFWSVPFGGSFWSWGPFLLTVAVTVTICWLPTIDRRWEAHFGSGDRLLRKYMPAAMLTAVMGAYFAGRSVDFTILIALLPLSMMIIPGFLWLAGIALTRDRVAISLTAIPLVALLWMSAFSCLYLFRADAPYSLIVQECRDHGRCSPAALIGGLSETWHRELALIPGTDRWAMNARDLEIVKDAKGLIEKYAANKRHVTVLLGESADGSQMLSDIALLYAAKWHKWPVSYVFSDQLVPSLVERILTTPLPLQSGDIVIQRRGSARLGQLERGISDAVKSAGALCLLDMGKPEVAGYRFLKKGDPIPKETCDEQEAPSGREFYNQEREILQALPPLVGNLRRSIDALPNGLIDLAALRQSDVAVPPPFARGDKLMSFWGKVTVIKAGKDMVLDLFGIRNAACRAMFATASRIVGIEQIAPSTAAADALMMPPTDEQVAQACAQDTRMVRMIFR